MLNALRAALVSRSDDGSGPDAELGLDFDAGDIFAPEGVLHGGDAGALALPAYYRGVALRAGLISSIPLRWQIGGQFQDELPPILAQPDPEKHVTVTIKELVASLDMRGNGIGALGGWDDLGFPNAMRVVHPGVVRTRRSPSNAADGSPPGTLFYDFGGGSHRWDQVFHVRGLTLPGSDMAVSPIEAMRRSLTGVRTVDEYGRRWFTKSGLPSVIVKINRPRKDLDEKELKLLKRKWMAMLAGGREPVFVPEDVSAESIGLSNDDAQFLETRKFGLTDVANIVGIPGYFIGADGSSRTYTNLQDERRALIDIYLREDMESIEDAFTRLLPVGRAKFDPSSFLRLDQKLTAETLNIEAQWMLIDEIRAVQGLPPLPNGQGQVLARPAPTREPAMEVPSDR